jgi:hypothetical protein
MNDFETNEISSADSYLTGQSQLKAPLRQLLGILDRVSALGFLQQRTLDDQYLPVQLGACLGRSVFYVQLDCTRYSAVVAVIAVHRDYHLSLSSFDRYVL